LNKAPIPVLLTGMWRNRGFCIRKPLQEKRHACYNGYTSAYRIFFYSWGHLVSRTRATSHEFFMPANPAWLGGPAVPPGHQREPYQRNAMQLVRCSATCLRRTVL
jgi:hypothetical protein